MQPQPQYQINPRAVLAIVVLLVLLSRGAGPVAPPGPPAPIKADGLHVLIVEETAERGKLSAGQLAILTSVQIREYVASKSGEMRILDDDAPLANESELWRQAMGITRQSLPWLIASNGKAGYSGPLPVSVDETLTILRKYGG